ncbi:MAG: HD domain-containing protein [bacterium]|nr:HD domain-containing protein [bacterium]
MKKNEIEVIIESIDRLLEGDYETYIAIDSQSELKELAEKINMLSKEIKYYYSIIKNISKGKFSSDIKGSRGIIAGLKSIQSSLMHLVWQAKRITDGDLAQRIFSMGDISEAFNEMVITLKEAKTIIDTKTEELKKKNIELRQLFASVTTGLSEIIGAKDEYIKRHSANVGEYAAIIAKKIGFSEEEIEFIRIAGNLHDLGKIGVKDDILNKPGELTEEEYRHVKKHPIISANILAEIKEYSSVVNSIQYHHEKFDGKGYPEGLKGKNIPIGARILAVADAYDDLSSDRPYHKAYKKEKIIAELICNKGKQFDPEVVDIFVRIIKNKEI